MHNVRNGLNPIKVILSRQLTDSRVSGSEDTAKALDELQQDSVAPERRVRLIQFLKLVIDADMAKEGRRREEIQTARDCLTNVVELIGKQQSAAHEKIDTEPCEIADVLRQNAALAQYSSAGKVRFVVEEGDVMGLGNRVLLSQVVGNLFANAVEAIAAANRETGLIEVTFVATPDVIEVRIRDNGEGFAPEKGKQLFERGFSSRKEKPGGLGLHWCANALTLMNGKLALESDGAG